MNRTNTIGKEIDKEIWTNLLVMVLLIALAVLLIAFPQVFDAAWLFMYTTLEAIWDFLTGL